MDSRILEYVLRVAELGSINKAAADLQLSQPSLSRHISSLEAELDVRLFNRTQGGVQLTEAGRLLTERGRPLLRQFSILKEQVGETASGQLALGIPASWHRIFTVPFATRMAMESAGLKLRIHEAVSHLLRDSMMAGVLDLCVMPFDPSTPSGFRQTALLREPLVVVGAPDAGFSAQEPVSIGRLDGANLVLPSRPNALRLHVEHTLSRKGLSFRTSIETDTVNLCLDLARNGLGLTVVPACALYGLPQAQDLCWAPLRGLYLTWALFENTARSHSQAVREGVRLLTATLSDIGARTDWIGLEFMGRLRSAETSAARAPAGGAIKA